MLVFQFTLCQEVSPRSKVTGTLLRRRSSQQTSSELQNVNENGITLEPDLRQVSSAGMTISTWRLRGRQTFCSSTKGPVQHLVLTLLVM